MRVVDVTQWFSPRSGGIHTYLHAKARHAALRGHDHVVIVPGRSASTRMFGGSVLIQVPGVRVDMRTGYRLVPRANHITTILDDLRPDVVVIHDATAFPMALRQWASTNGAGLAMVVHSDLAMAAAGIRGPLRPPVAAALRLIQDRGLRAPDAVIVTSETMRQRIAGRTAADLVLSPLGVDFDAFGAADPDPDLRRRLNPSDGPLLVHVGRLSPEKRVDLLPGVLAALPASTVLAIAGAGPGEPALRRRAIRLGVADRMRFLGHIFERSTLATLLTTADCFVHPNPDEAFGLAPLEALAAGCRLVAANNGGLADTVRGLGAVLVAPGDARALAQGVVRALEQPRPDPNLREVSWERTFEREWDLYARLAVAAAA